MKVSKLMSLYNKGDSISLQVCSRGENKISELYIIIDGKKICFQSHIKGDQHWIECKEIENTFIINPLSINE